MAAEKTTLWAVGCEGHRTAWVIAPSWELATVEAAKFWKVPWREVAARCEEVMRKQGITNICCICGRTYHGAPPMCEACRLTEETEEQQDALRRRRAYIKDDRAYEALGLKKEEQA